MKRYKTLPRSKRTELQKLKDQQCLRQLQKSIAVAKCIAIAAEYSEHDDIDLADALAVLLLPLERAAALLDSPGGAS